MLLKSLARPRSVRHFVARLACLMWRARGCWRLVGRTVRFVRRSIGTRFPRVSTQESGPFWATVNTVATPAAVSMFGVESCQMEQLERVKSLMWPQKPGRVLMYGSLP